MTDDEERRFATLQSEWCDQRLIQELYGIDLNREAKFFKHFKIWVEQRKGRAINDAGAIHRYRFETFLQSTRLLTKKWGAIRLGMSADSLDALLTKMDATGLVFSYYPSNESHALVGEKIDHDLLEVFEEFRFRTFSSHDDFCRRLHGAIEGQYGLKVEPEFDFTSKKLSGDKDQWCYGHDWDAISLEPVGLQYQVWLDLGKPMNLRPDCVSSFFYAKERERLKDHVAGSTEPDLSQELIEAVDAEKRQVGG